MPNKIYEFCSSKGIVVSPYDGEVHEGESITISTKAKDNGTPLDMHKQEEHVATWYPLHRSALQDQVDLVSMVQKLLQKAPDVKDVQVWKALRYKGTSVSIFMNCSNASARAAVKHLQQHGTASLWTRDRVAKQRERDAAVRMSAMTREETIGDVVASTKLVEKLQAMIGAGKSKNL